MLKFTLSFLCLCSALPLLAQQIQQTLQWQEAETIEWEGQRSAVLSYRLGGAAGATKSGEVPAFVHTFRAASGAPQRVEVTSLETEPFTPPVRLCRRGARGLHLRLHGGAATRGLAG